MADIKSNESEGEKQLEAANSSSKPTIGVVSCDDEGYETAGKKTIQTRPKATKEGRKVAHSLYHWPLICKTYTFAATGHDCSLIHVWYT